MIYCAWCGDPFDPVEYRPPSIDEPNFCSDLCEDAHTESLDMDQIYREGRYSGAPVF